MWLIAVAFFLTCPVPSFFLQRGGGGAATKRGLDQHRRQQGLLSSPPGCVEGRRTYCQTAHPPRTFTPQTQRAGQALHLLVCACVCVVFLDSLLTVHPKIPNTCFSSYLKCYLPTPVTCINCMRRLHLLMDERLELMTALLIIIRNWAKCRLVPFYVRVDTHQQNSATHTKTF